MMNSILTRLQKVSDTMKDAGLTTYANELEELKQLTRGEEDDDNEEGDRSLYEAEPTGIPGTWSEPDGDIVKTSRD